MKSNNFFLNMLSGNSETSHKRFESIVALLTLVILAILDSCGLKTSEIMVLTLAGIACGQSYLTVKEKKDKINAPTPPVSEDKQPTN